MIEEDPEEVAEQPARVEQEAELERALSLDEQCRAAGYLAALASYRRVAETAPEGGGVFAGRLSRKRVPFKWRSTPRFASWADIAAA